MGLPNIYEFWGTDLNYVIDFVQTGSLAFGSAERHAAFRVVRRAFDSIINHLILCAKNPGTPWHNPGTPDLRSSHSWHSPRGPPPRGNCPKTVSRGISPESRSRNFCPATAVFTPLVFLPRDLGDYFASSFGSLATTFPFSHTYTGVPCIRATSRAVRAARRNPRPTPAAKLSAFLGSFDRVVTGRAPAILV